MLSKATLAKTGMMFVAITAFSVVFAHMSCIWLGPECFYVQRAPLSVVESSEKGTWFAPIVTTLVSTLFLISALYALSGGKFIRQLPLLKIGIYTIGTICLARGILVIPIICLHSEYQSSFEIIAAAVWLFCGALLIYGYRTLHQR